ncbi:hypothetical protein PR048_009692 [Dryococelus australis]|uniref:Uncharacterized protein n=1 Tax=Dryococelus australis TaxID=614101 RepID=A0ABQ9I1N7_9NEOP|nr:hypothetical protein PR048_009692 [Dryococelus australis]
MTGEVADDCLATSVASLLPPFHGCNLLNRNYQKGNWGNCTIRWVARGPEGTLVRPATKGAAGGLSGRIRGILAVAGDDFRTRTQSGLVDSALLRAFSGLYKLKATDGSDDSNSKICLLVVTYFDKEAQTTVLSVPSLPELKGNSTDINICSTNIVSFCSLHPYESILNRQLDHDLVTGSATFDMGIGLPLESSRPCGWLVQLWTSLLQAAGMVKSSQSAEVVEAVLQPVGEVEAMSQVEKRRERSFANQGVLLTNLRGRAAEVLLSRVAAGTSSTAKCRVVVHQKVLFIHKGGDYILGSGRAALFIMNRINHLYVQGCPTRRVPLVVKSDTASARVVAVWKAILCRRCNLGPPGRDNGGKYPPTPLVSRNAAPTGNRTIANRCGVVWDAIGCSVPCSIEDKFGKLAITEYPRTVTSASDENQR